MIAIYNRLNQYEMNSDAYKMNSFNNLGGNFTHIRNDQQETKYQCPMNCEGNKTYYQSGACPVCAMQLVIVGKAETRIHMF